MLLISLIWNQLTNKRYYWHQEVGSDQFCLIINSPWLYVFTLLLYLYPLVFYYYKFLLYSISTSFINFIIIILTLLLVTNHYKDILKEYYKKYEIFYLNFYLVFFQFILSETLLFISFFWVSYHSYFSSNIYISIFLFLPIPITLTYTNTILLSNAGISLGNTFHTIQLSTFHYLYYNFLSFSFGITFLYLLVNEFPILSFSINDSLYGSIFFYLTGLHFFHLIIGLSLLSLLFWSCHYSSICKITISTTIYAIH